MSLTQLQERIRARKTPLALTLSPDPDRLSPKILKNFTDMFGDVPMARAEALRYHGTSLLDAAAGKLPAVVLRADAYLSQGMMGADVLSNLITAAHAKELYVILDVNAADPAPWLSYGADAVTVCPYAGKDCLAVPEDRLAIAAAPATPPAVRCRRCWPATGRCGSPWRKKWPAAAQRCLWPQGTAWMCGMCGGSAPAPFCCCPAVTAKTPWPPLTTSATAHCWPTRRCNTPPTLPPL